MPARDNNKGARAERAKGGMRLRFVTVAVAAALLAAPAIAQIILTPEQRCAQGWGNDSIAACSDVIGIGTGGAEISWAYFNRARAYFGLKLYASAVEDLNSVLKFNPNDAQALENRGLAQAILGNTESAIKDFDKLVELEPNSADAYRERCWARTILGRDLNDALHDCSQAVTIKPNDAAALDARCFVKYRGEAYDRAIPDCTAALAINPNLASSLYIRGLARLKMKDVDGGNADIVAAKQINPIVAETYASYGVRP